MEKLKEFRELESVYTKQAIAYEEKKSYEMAYLSLWIILEKGLRVYADDAVKLELHNKIQLWDEYLSGKKRNAPTEIKNCNLEYTYRTIPRVSLIENALGKMPAVHKVLNSQGKWRRKRNSIAHKASNFSSVNLYNEYKHELLSAINQLSKKTALYASKNR